MNQRRQVGFIKSYSNKQLILQDQPSEFSYFRMKGKQDEEEFSPYKFEEDQIELAKTAKVQKKKSAKPPLPARGRQMEHNGSNLVDKVKADTIYDKIKQRIASYEQKRSASKQKLQQNIGNIRNKIQRLDQVLKDLKTQKEPPIPQEHNKISRKHQKYQEDSSSSESEEEQEVVVNAIPSPKLPQQQISEIKRTSNSRERPSLQLSKEELQVRNPSQQHCSPQQEEQQQEEEEYQISHQQSSQNRSKEQHPHQQKVITFNSRLRNQPPLYIKKYSSSSSSQSEQPQIEPKHIPQRDHIVTKQTHGNTQFYRNKGGVCFDVDVKQFASHLPPEKKEKPVRQKKQKVDPRAQLLRRRQTAKAYDKKARRALFSPY